MKTFIKTFGISKLFDEKKLRKISNTWFSVDEPLKTILKRIKLPPIAAGLCLGQFNAKLKPSPDTLHVLAKTPTKKAWVNKKGEWMFICRKPVLAKSIVRNDAEKGDRVLVLNQYNECIGFGRFDGKKIKNEYDIGDFLRRERT